MAIKCFHPPATTIMGLKWWDDFREQHPELCETWAMRWALVRPYLPPVNFITLHYAYFIVTAIIGALIFWGSSSPQYSIGWWDSLFMVMSALTASGLNTINVSQLTTFQQVQLCVFMIMGSQIIISYFTIAFRKRIFEKRFEDLVEMERAKRRATTSKTGAIVGMTGAMVGLQVMSSFGKTRGGKEGPSSRPWSSKHNNEPNVQAAKPGLPSEEPTTLYSQEQTSSATGILGGGERDPSQPQHVGFLEPIRENRPQSATTGHSIYQTHSLQSGNTSRRRPHTVESRTSDTSFNVQTFVKEQKGNIGRNGQFFNLSEDQREYLGGVEYRSLKFLSTFVIVYFVLWQLFGAIALGAWMSVYTVDESAVNAQNPWWAGIFLAISAYNNAGFTLLDAGFVPFQGSYFLLTMVTILSLAGPAAFPVFMRLLIWTMSKVFHLFSRDEEDYTLWKEGFDFILRFPRRVYTSLFPARDTWMFVATFGGFVLADWILILVLTTGNPTMDAIPLGQRIFDAMFEGFCKLHASLTVSETRWPFPDLLIPSQPFRLEATPSSPHQPCTLTYKCSGSSFSTRLRTRTSSPCARPTSTKSVPWASTTEIRPRSNNSTRRQAACLTSMPILGTTILLQQAFRPHLVPTATSTEGGIGTQSQRSRPRDPSSVSMPLAVKARHLWAGSCSAV